jgi:transcriptional adapter 2-alpha
MSSCLCVLDGSRRFSVGDWGDVYARLNSGSGQECERVFMMLYEIWARLSDAPFPSVASDVVDGCLAASSSPNSNGMFVHGIEASREADMPGFLSKRGDFDFEFDDSAELILADLELSDLDTFEEINSKLASLRAYTERIQNREYAKNFVVRNGLLNYQDQANGHRSRTIEESDLRGKLRPLQRFFPAQAFDEFTQLLLHEHRLRQRLRTLESIRFVKSEQRSFLVKQHDPDDGRPTTRSRSGVDSRRGMRTLEEDCLKIREQLATAAIRESLASTLCQSEREELDRIGLLSEFYAILKNSFLHRADEENCVVKRVNITRHGHVFSLQVQN